MRGKCPNCGKMVPSSFEDNGLIVAFCDKCGTKPSSDPNDEFDPEVYGDFE
jgi:endogenous inhibitor of DNA gyrase (YacG/DUF329 family)